MKTSSQYEVEKGVTLAHSLTGKGNPVVLLHGWACNRLFWREQVPILERSHRVLALDFRGHGESSAPESGYTLRQLARDVHVLIHGLDLAPAVVVGHSMGGMVAQQLAASHPEVLSGLVLVATTSADPRRSLISATIAAETLYYGFRSAFARNFPRWFPPNADKKIVSWIRSQMLRTPEHVALSLVRDYQDLDFRTDLKEIRLPTLVIQAEADVSTPTAHSRLIASLVPDAKLVTVEGVGHFVQLERPLEVNAAIQEFLQACKL